MENFYEPRTEEKRQRVIRSLLKYRDEMLKQIKIADSQLRELGYTDFASLPVVKSNVKRRRK